MSEEQFIASESAKIAATIRRHLKQVKKTGFISAKLGDPLWFAGLITNSSPTEAIPYNHYRLTPAGEAF